jgi:hypothetical protein
VLKPAKAADSQLPLASGFERQRQSVPDDSSTSTGQRMFEKSYLLPYGCVQKQQRALYKTRGRESMIILGLTSDGTGSGERQSVLCVDQWYSDWDRAKTEQSSASGARYWVRAASGPLPKKWMDKNWLICKKVILKLLMKCCLFITDYLFCL